MTKLAILIITNMKFPVNFPFPKRCTFSKNVHHRHCLAEKDKNGKVRKQSYPWNFKRDCTFAQKNEKSEDFGLLIFINIRAILANLYYSVTTKTSDTNVNKYKSKAPTQTNITSYLQRSKLIT